jgi:ketosteroid isomerase-like protein
MLNRWPLMLLTCAWFLLVGCSRTPTGNTHAESAVREADDAWSRAIASKSVDQTVSMYDPEAITAGSAMFPARGVAAFRKNWEKLFAQPDFSLVWKVENVVVTESGTIAYSTGSWHTADPKVSGPYLAVWRKQPDGQWKVLVDAAWISPTAKVGRR